jgi:putative DNA primase/helicase
MGAASNVVALERAPFERGDHVEIAQRLVSKLRVDGDVVHDDGITWQYSERSHVFEAVDLARASQIVQGFAGCKIRSDKKPLRLKASDVGGSIKLAWDLLSRPGFFADAPRGVVFESSFVEVTADKIIQHEHSPKHRARFAYAFGFQPNPNPRHLLKFFGEVFAPDSDAEQKIALFQEYVGGAMLGLSTRYQRAVAKLGDGSNGKGVLAEIIQSAMPPGACVAIAPQDFGDEYRAAMLAGKLMNLVSELPESEILDSEAFKAVIAGDARTGRHIRQAPFTFRPIAGHLFAANRMPGTADQSHGFWRRFIVVGFNRIFAEHEQDSTLASRIIAAELPAIVSWFLLGAQRVLRQGGYTVPASSAAAVDAWRRAADQVRAFVEDWTTRLPSEADARSGAGADELYRSFRAWANQNGHRPVASNKFGERMRQLGLKAQHTNAGNFYPVRLEKGFQ